MRNLFLMALAPLALVACTEQQTCEARARNHMHDIDLQIRETRQNLERGYVLVEQDFGLVIGTRICSDTGTVQICTGGDFPQYRRVRIDPAAEQAKLDALERRKVALAREFAQCAALEG